MKALYYKKDGVWKFVFMHHNNSSLTARASDYLSKGLAVKIMPYKGGLQ